MNKSVSSSKASSKSSSRLSPSFISNKIQLKIPFKDKALMPVQFESTKSITQSIFKHS